MRRLRIVHYRIKRRKSLRLADRPFRFVVLSDLHNASIGAEGGLLRRQIHRLSPDAILCTGDMLTAKWGMVRMNNACSLLACLAGSYPVFAVNGNHETRLQEKYAAPEWTQIRSAYFETLEQAGVKVLNNRAAVLDVAGTQVWIGGFEASLKYYRRGRSRRKEAIGPEAFPQKPSASLFTILLAHHPDYFQSYARWGADLVLAGHLHGGMVRLPLLGGLVGAGYNLFPEYDRGRYLMQTGHFEETVCPDRKSYPDGRALETVCAKEQKMGHTAQMIVSAGLGDHTIPLRLNNPPELVVLDF